MTMKRTFAAPFSIVRSSHIAWQRTPPAASGLLGATPIEIIDLGDAIAATACQRQLERGLRARPRLAPPRALQRDDRTVDPTPSPLAGSPRAPPGTPWGAVRAQRVFGANMVIAARAHGHPLTLEGFDFAFRERSRRVDR